MTETSTMSSAILGRNILLLLTGSPLPGQPAMRVLAVVG
jgi:hypothetical protein